MSGGSKSIFTAEMQEFLAEHAAGTRTPQLTQMLNEKFGTSYKESQVNNYRKNKHLPAGLGQGVPKDQGTEVFPLEVVNFIRDHVKGMYNPDLTRLVNKTFGRNYKQSQIKAFKKNHHMPSGLTGRFEKGMIPVNKGKKQTDYMSPEAIERTKKTRFKKNDRPWNALPVGSELRRSFNGGRAELTFIKVAEPAVWKSKGRYIWEQAHGEIPEGHVVVFRDGDTTNFDIDNLDCIPVKLNGRINASGYRRVAGAMGLDIAKLEYAIEERTEKLMKGEKKDVTEHDA